MRVNGEITKQEFSSMKNKINGEMLMAEKEVEEAKTLLLEEKITVLIIKFILN